MSVKFSKYNSLDHLIINLFGGLTQYPWTLFPIAFSSLTTKAQKCNSYQEAIPISEG